MQQLPNLLSLSRLPLAVGLFVCISHEAWLVGLIVFLIAALTDWADGWVARKWNIVSDVGRNLDPLTDKVLICGTFIFLIPVPAVGVTPWMTTVIVCREILITGLRGIVESMGKKFGADWFGKLKTVLQCVVIIGLLLLQTLRQYRWLADLIPAIEGVCVALLWAMLAATVGSALQYCWKAWRLLS